MRLDREARLGGRVNVAVAVADELREIICEVAAACRAVGFEHATTLGGIGVFTGSAPVDALADLRGVPGVIAVEVQRPFRTQSLAAPTT
jgi:hypothetical protein